MRIALIGRRFDPGGGGTERDLIVTADILTRAGHQLSIYADDLRGNFAQWRPRRVSAPPLGRALRLLWFARRAPRVARSEGAEVVLSFARVIDADILRSGGAAHSSYMRAARRWLSPGGAIALRLSPYHRVQVAVEKRGFSSPNLKRAIAVSDLVRTDLVETFALTPRKAVTLHNGVDLDRFRPSPDRTLRSQVRDGWEIPSDAPVVLFIGNGFARKGLRFLIEAWPALDPRAHLIAAGTDRALASYRRLAMRLGVGNRVRFLGPQRQIERLFAAADALALPSLFEPFGNVVMEAMAAGLPVLCSSACGASEALPPDFRPFVVNDPANVSELAARMAALLSVRGDLASIARATAEKFTWDRYAKDLLNLLQGL
jgi:UDP-glucose:(heptosyl)LPS alpha-1,3-glucosyltransferase